VCLCIWKPTDFLRACELGKAERYWVKVKVFRYKPLEWLLGFQEVKAPGSSQHLAL
jgi:hypothetical protein